MFEEKMIFSELLKKIEKKLKKELDQNFKWEKCIIEDPEKILGEVGKSYETLFKRYLSTQDGLTELSDKLNNAKQAITILEAEKAQWVQQKVMQDQIIQQALESSNSMSNSYLEENVGLKEEIRNLKKEILNLKKEK